MQKKTIDIPVTKCDENKISRINLLKSVGIPQGCLYFYYYYYYYYLYFYFLILEML